MRPPRRVPIHLPYPNAVPDPHAVAYANTHHDANHDAYVNVNPNAYANTNVDPNSLKTSQPRQPRACGIHATRPTPAKLYRAIVNEPPLNQKPPPKAPYLLPAAFPLRPGSARMRSRPTSPARAAEILNLHTRLNPRANFGTIITKTIAKVPG